MLSAVAHALSRSGAMVGVPLLGLAAKSGGRRGAVLMARWGRWLGFAGLALAYRALTLLPVNRRTIVFVSYPDATDNARAVYDHLVSTTQGYRFVWLVHAARPELVSELAGAELIDNRSPRAAFVTARAGLVFHTHGIWRFACRRRGQTMVNLWHGMPLKTIGAYDVFNPILPLGDYTIATSPLFAQVMAKAFRVGVDTVLMVGQPRNDALYAKAHAEGATPGGDIALWMPTYRFSREGIIRTDSALTSQGFLAMLDTLDAALVARGAKVMLKLHPMDALNDLIKAPYQAISVIFGHDRRESVEALMARARCLVSDYSSAAIDYAILGRPIGYYCPDRADYVRGFVPEVVEPFYAMGPMLTSVDEMADFFASPPPVSQQGRAALVSDCDGNATRRLWARLQQMGAV